MNPIGELVDARRLASVRGGILDFKDEGENLSGLPFGKLTLRATGVSVHPDGRWVTKYEAKRIAAAWGVELFEY